MSSVAVTPGRDEILGFIVEYPAMGDVVRSKEKIPICSLHNEVQCFKVKKGNSLPRSGLTRNG